MKIEIKESNGCYSCNCCETKYCASYEVDFANGFDIMMCQSCINDLKLAMIEFEEKINEEDS